MISAPTNPPIKNGIILFVSDTDFPRTTFAGCYCTQDISCHTWTLSRWCCHSLTVSPRSSSKAGPDEARDGAEHGGAGADGQLDGEPGQQTRPAERRSASLMFSRVTLRAAQRSSQLHPGR